MFPVKNDHRLKQLLILFGVTFFFIIILNTQFSIININNSNEIKDHDEITKDLDPLDKAGFWNLNWIHIDNNWSDTAENDWCNGSGTWNDPYIIKNVCVDAQNTGNGIIIENSADYFILNNLTIYKSELAADYAGIKINNTSNGIISNSKVYNNYHGIYLNNGSANITIIGNNISYNGDGSSGYGIYIYDDSNNNTIFNNSINNNDGFGIYLYSSSTFNNISSNNISQNGDIGIRINAQCHNTTISNNIVDNNQQDSISISFSNGISIFSNYISFPQNPNINGLTLFMSNFITIVRNTFRNNTGDGFFIQNSNDITITENLLEGNDRGIYIDSGSNINVFKNAMVDNNESVFSVVLTVNWNNSKVGNYWSDHSSTDVNRDGICDDNYIVNGGGTDNLPIYGNPIHNGNKIHIDESNSSGDGTWQWASTRLWCTGSGAKSDPYVIDGLAIDAEAFGNALLIGNSSVYFRIENCDVTNSGSGTFDAGIKLYTTTNGIITNNNASFNLGSGIFLIFSENNTVTSNFVRDNNKYGISISFDCDNTNVSENEILYHDLYGMSLSSSDNLKIENNLFTECGIYMTGTLEELISIQINTSNLVNGKPIYYYINEKRLTPSNFSNAGQIFLTNCNDSLISNLNNSKCTVGVLLHYSYNNTISNNNLNSSYVGINLRYSDNNTISHNILHQNSNAVDLYYSNNITIRDNDITNSSSRGLSFYVADNNTIHSNLISYSSNNGIYLNSAVTSCDSNLIYNNTFIGNANHATDLGDFNNWNNSFIGNYWDDYLTMGAGAVDADDDGIGDIPYNISGSAGARDYLPIWDDGSEINYWILDPIHIDDSGASGNGTWAWAATQEWCSGSGTWSDPYILANITIDGQNVGSCIIIGNSSVYFRIENCTVYNCGGGTYDAGIRLTYAHNGTLINNNASFNSRNGICLRYSDKNSISGNILDKNYNGLRMAFSDDCYIVGNNLSYNNPDGMEITTCYDVNLSGNIFKDSGLLITAGSKQNAIDTFIDTTNLINGKPIFYYGNKNGLTSSNFTNPGQIILAYCNNSIISGFNISTNSRAIRLQRGYNNQILNNNVSYNYHGIDISYCYNTTVSENNASYCEDGIYVEYGYNNSISRNDANFNTNYAIHLIQTYNNSISKNILKNNYRGIFLSYCENISIFRNNVSYGNYGIELFVSDNNTLYENIIHDTTSVGIYLNPAAGSSDYNLLFNNTFIGNPENAIDGGSNNDWNNTVIGNYWDDYLTMGEGAEDLDDDGIGDVPYNVSGTAGARDYLPIWDDGRNYFWTMNPIHIDDSGASGNGTWSWAASKPWCSGSGTWSDPYVIENLTINGQNSFNCILIGNSSVYFRIENCTVYNSGGGPFDAGIKLSYTNNGTIVNNSVSFNNGNGFALEYSANNSISGNNASYNTRGMRLYSCDYNTISRNNITFNSDVGILLGSLNNTIIGNTISSNTLNGIYLANPQNITVSGNILNENGIDFTGSLQNAVSTNIDLTNLENGKPIYFYANKSGLTSSNFSNPGQIILAYCNNSIIENFNLSYCSKAIILYQCYNNTILKNNLNLNYYGIYLNLCTKNNITRNNVSSNANRGISLYSCNNNSVSENIIDNDNLYGLILEWSNNNSIFKNNFTNSFQNAIRLSYSYNNMVYRNNFINGTYFGIFLYSADQNTLYENLIENFDEIGIFLSPTGVSDYNRFYNNTLTGNNIHAQNYGDNDWNNTIIGNYWDNYTGRDADDNGIGDDPHIFYGGIDYLPIWDDGLDITYWFFNTIHIDDSGASGNGTWAWAASQNWCQGSGTWSDPYRIENATIDGQNAVKCIIIGNSSVYFRIENCTLINSNNLGTLWLEDVSNGTLMNNNFSLNWGRGILLIKCTNMSIIGNNFSDSFDGIYIGNSSIITLSGNTFDKLGLDVQGSLQQCLTYNIETSNTVNGKVIYYFSNKTGLISTNFSNPGYILLAYCNNSNISNFKGLYGINLYQCYYNTIKNNSISQLNFGIYFSSSYKNNITENNLTNCKNGIFLFNAGNNTVLNNNITFNTNMGIYLIGNSEYNEIFNNTITDNNLYGIISFNGKNNTIHFNNVSNNNHWGIWIAYTQNTNISNNIIKNNPDGGISFQFSSRLHILNNTISYAMMGIWCINSANITLSGNIMFKNGIIVGEPLENAVSYNIDTTNTVNGKPVYYYVNKTGLQPSDFSNPGQIILAFCNDSLISNFNLTHGGTGIYLIGCYNNSILSNNVSCNRMGMWLINCENNTILGNIASFNSDSGIYLYLSNNNTIRGNTAYNNSQMGISLTGSDLVIIEGNNASFNGNDGIYLRDSDTNIIKDNLISNNIRTGVYISNHTGNSFNNIIYNNTFIANGLNAQDDGFFNNWDYTLIGNYWDDYAGTDANDDGIGESPYDIVGVANKADYYPIWDDGFNGSIIFIDDNSLNNWIWAGTRIWCSGSGTWSDPYIIKDLIINGQELGSCILISNSSVYFIIRNCTVYNSGNGQYDAGIKLINVNNSQIIDNSLYSNTNGILILTGYNNTISGNSANFNDVSGIALFFSNNNTISQNLETFNNNGFWGIFLNNSHGNDILDNIANHNNYGIYLNYSSFNLIKDNNFLSNYINWFYEEGICEGNQYVNNQFEKDQPSNDDDDDSANEVNLMIIIIIIIIGGAVAASALVIVSKKKEKPITPLKEEFKQEEAKPTDLKILEPGETEGAGVPEREIKPKKIGKEVLPTVDVTEEEKKELEDTEKEVGVEEQQFICIVHKGPIVGANIYLCPHCKALYCIKCATSLKEKGEQCWSCQKDFEL